MREVLLVSREHITRSVITFAIITITPAFSIFYSNSFLTTQNTQSLSNMPVHTSTQSKTLAAKLASLRSKQELADHDEEGLVSPSTKPPTPLSELLKTSSAGLLMDGPSTHSNDLFFGNVNYHGGHQHDSAPSDGDTVWYCSICGDGPMGAWNPTCASCGHAYCGACTVETA